MGLDNRGVVRGGCSVSGCPCGDFEALPSRHVCGSCHHPPAKHASVAQPVPPPYPSVVQGCRGRGYSTGDMSHLAHTHPWTRAQHNHHQRSFNICLQCRQPCAVLGDGLRCERCSADSRPCKREGCSSPRFYDPVLGEFKYCSPQCRNEDYLPRYARKLKDSLEQSKERCTMGASLGSTSSSALRRSNSHSNIASLALSTGMPSHSPQTHMYSPQTHRRRQS